MDIIETRILWWMFAIALFSLLLIGTVGGFWAAVLYASGLVLAAHGYWLWIACRPRLVCVPVHTLTGIYLYREVVRG